MSTSPRPAARPWPGAAGSPIILAARTRHQEPMSWSCLVAKTEAAAAACTPSPPASSAVLAHRLPYLTSRSLSSFSPPELELHHARRRLHVKIRWSRQASTPE